jgi:hypothetical protein
MTDETLNSGATPAEQCMRVFISFAEGEEEFADYLGYVLALRGFEPSTCPAPRFRRRIIGKAEASVFVLTAAAAASKRVIGELAETVHQEKPALILVPGALTGVAIPAEFSAHSFIQSWRNPDVAGSSLVNGLLALENALDAVRLSPRMAPAAELDPAKAVEPAVAEVSKLATTLDPIAAAPEPAVQEAVAPVAEEPAEAQAFSIEALTSQFAEAFAEASQDTEPTIAEQPATIEPAITSETIAAELIAEPLFAPALASQEPAAEPKAEFIFETLEPQPDPNPALSPVFKVSLEPTYDVLDLTVRAEDALPPPVLPPLVIPQVARALPKPPVRLAVIKGQGPRGSGNARRRSVAHLAIVTASLMCAAANAPWLISFLSSARAAAAEEGARPPALKPVVTIRNSEPEAPEVETAPAPVEPDAIEPEPAFKEPEADTAAPEALAIEPAPAAPAPREEPAAPILTDAELLQQQDHADWLEARKIGNLAAFRAYIEKHADGVHYAEAMDRARRRIAELSTQPNSTLVYLTGPAFFRALPTRDVDGLEAGAAGQDVYIIDRIATRREGEWLVFERGGLWPFLFVGADEVEKTEATKAETGASH